MDRNLVRNYRAAAAKPVFIRETPKARKPRILISVLRDLAATAAIAGIGYLGMMFVFAFFG